MPKSTSEASSSDESTLNQITSDDTSDTSSESIEPITPDTEAITTEKGEPINDETVTSYYEAQTSFDVEKQFDDSPTVKLD